MSIKSILDTYNQINESSLEESLSSPTLPETTNNLFDELEKDMDVAKDIILAKMSERDLVNFMLMVQKMAVTACMMSGSKFILQADISGELQGYTHSVVLSVIGALIQDEIL